MGCLVCHPKPFTASYDFKGKVCRFHGVWEAVDTFLSVSLLGFARAKNALCFFFLFGLSTLAHTSRLMFGGAIPDNKYNSSTLVGLRHPVIARHSLLSSASSL